MGNRKREGGCMGGEGLFEHVELAHFFASDNLPLEDAGKPCRVVAAVFELFKSREANLSWIARSDVSKNPTHKRPLLIGPHSNKKKNKETGFFSVLIFVHLRIKMILCYIPY
jgi:hypothetical protein